MNEKLLHFVWQNKVFPKDLHTVSGKKVKVVHPGFPSSNAGADFINSKIYIDNKLWFGNVEIHSKSSDWYRHHHDKDSAYNNVILHVVLKYDRPVYRQNGEKLPTVVLQVPEEIIQRYQRLKGSSESFKCSFLSKKVPFELKQLWLSSLLIERLQQRYHLILDSVKTFEGDWERAFFVRLSRSFGQNVNSEPFEQLARIIPLKVLLRNRDNRIALEAILFGCAGFLTQSYEDKFYKELKREYLFLKQKYQLQELPVHIWKFLRTRPYNFPTVRISQLADVLSKNINMFSYVLEEQDLSNLIKYFQAKASEYWDNHYVFGKLVGKSFQKVLGKSTAENIIINTVVPFLFAYGKYLDESEYINRAISFLEQMEYEKNKVTLMFKRANFPSENAYHSQAILQLYSEYCKKERCFQCQIGSYILMNPIQ